jgi:hypothetical protein
MTRKHATEQGLPLEEQEYEWIDVETEEEKGAVLKGQNKMSESKNMGYLDFRITRRKSPFLFILYRCDSDKFYSI